MIRLFLRLFGIRDYEVCQSCETLKEQLAYERAEKAKLTNTLLNIIQPKVIPEQPVVEMNSLQQTSALFSRRRAALEASERESAKIVKSSTNLGKPDGIKEIEKLEKELNVEEEKGA